MPPVYSGKCVPWPEIAPSTRHQLPNLCRVANNVTKSVLLIVAIQTSQICVFATTYQKRRDTVGEVGSQAAIAAKREVRVGASGRWANHAPSRSRLMAAAVAILCRPILAS